MDPATKKSIRRQDRKQSKTAAYRSRATARQFASTPTAARSSGT
ncbi:hypothetical protein [Gemmata sp.]